MTSSGSAKRWLVYKTKSVFVIADNLDWPAGKQNGAAPTDEVRFLAISRDTGTAREARETSANFHSKLVTLQASGGGDGALQPKPCDAVLGCIAVPDQEEGAAHGQSGKGGASVPTFLLLVTESHTAMKAGGQKVLEIRRCEALPFTSAENCGESASSALDNVLQLLDHCFYFSHNVDVTRRLQRRVSSKPPDADHMISLADKRFVWNQTLAEPLMQQEGVSPRWFTPIMQGFFQQRELRSGSSTKTAAPTIVLVGRRSCRHQGTRFSARGIDDDGEAANWVETEQLVHLPGESSWLSLVQVRGSAPVYWEQPSLTAGVTLTRGAQLAAVGFERHLRLLEAEYGKLLYVSLLSNAPAKQATEGILTAALAEQQVKHRSSGLEILNLDIRARTSWNESDIVQVAEVLANEIVAKSDRFGYLEVHGPIQEGRECNARQNQSGVVRTNCLDCLDRTNLVQCQLAWVWLSRLFAARGGDLARLVKNSSPPQGASSAAKERHGIDAVFGALVDMASGDVRTSSSLAPLQSLLFEMWADLGDVLSELYAGAQSTMAATLRQGGTNVSSVMEKGLATMSRVVSARVGDEARQDALRLLLGQQKLLRIAPSSETRRAPCGQLTVAVVTWNLHGHEPPKDAISTLIRGTCAPGKPAPGKQGGQAPDVLILCCQELIELSPANVVSKAQGDEAVQADLESTVLASLRAAQGESFVKVQGVGMVGLYTGVFVAARLQNRVRGVAVDRVRSGHHGLTGNKGAAAVRFEVASTSVCALSLHLESGNGKAAERASQLEEVLERSFCGDGHKKVPALDQHDLLLLGGDFNFRLSLPKGGDLTSRATLAQDWTPSSGCESAPVGEGVAAKSGKEAISIFEEFDELYGAKRHRACSETLSKAGLTEGPVLFPPTYRLMKDTVLYDDERIPAWTDRIFHTRVGASRRKYCALGGVRHSDHRPVCALLETHLLAKPGEEPDAKELTKRNESASAQVAQSRALAEVDLLGADTSPAASTANASQGAAASGKATADSGYKSWTPSGRSDSGYKSWTPGGAGKAAAKSSGSTAPAVASAKPAAAASQRLPPASSSPPSGLKVGQLVLAEFRGSWYYANVSRLSGGTCDVAWLRPRADQWGSGESLKHYLCSTDADETQHGTGLSVAAQIRLPQGHGAGSAVAAAAPPPLIEAKLEDFLGEQLPGDLLS